VLIAAIQNTAIERFKILMQFAGFTNSPTEIECFSANRAVAKNQNTALIDFGAATTKMYLSHNGVLNRMHRINVGGAEITAKFAQATGLGFEAAENAKLLVQPNSEHYELLRGLYAKQYSRALRECRQVFDHYQADTGATFDHIKIAGGSSLFRALPGIVGDAFGLDVEVTDPFKLVAYPAFMEDTIKTIGPLFVPALGAALRTFE
jgi:Tfp pilus assembly PilM family ATPase